MKPKRRSTISTGPGDCPWWNKLERRTLLRIGSWRTSASRRVWRSLASSLAVASAAVSVVVAVAAAFVVPVHQRETRGMSGIGSVCTLTGGRCDRASLYNKLHLLLLSQMIGSECFNVLRTEQQLGYVVFCFSCKRELWNRLVLIQSQAYNFLFDYHNSTLSSPSFNETFVEQLSVLRSTLEERDLTLGDRSNRLWAQVNSGQQQFTYNQELVDIINEGSDELNAQTMRDFYEDHILKAQKLVTVC
ncbi:uncharacterized protein LOC135333201 isoform X2 [Halichondria panicea]|uniref:uncharacterized protein LOC135333201 isoform X2 n=1 Tax=Halichondria panicea TaxID=6063 RepID=UPI00312BBF6F